jgi:hypothetical protein
MLEDPKLELGRYLICIPGKMGTEELHECIGLAELYWWCEEYFLRELELK